MLRRSHFQSDQQYFHVVLSHETFGPFLNLHWIQACRLISKLSEHHRVQCVAFVMLSTHSHLLLRTSNHSENFFAEQLLMGLNPNIDITSHPVFIERVINITQFLKTYKYIYRNPVEAGLARTCERYEFSTLGMVLGHVPRRIQIWEPLNIVTNPMRILSWLNEPERKLISRDFGSSPVANSSLLHS